MASDTGVRLSLQNISKTFRTQKGGQQKVVDNVSLDVKNNEFLVMLGPGYCGKTVILNLITKLLKQDKGEIFLDGEELSKNEEANKKISMVFQKLGLLPWKTVIENVELGPKLTGVDKNVRREKAMHYIELVGLQGFENSYPHQLSGGMKQRVGIARAYTNNPEILIMDEPFGQLDAQTRYDMQNEIIRIWEKEKRTILFVTNNIEEAVYLGDRIVLLTELPARVKEIYDVPIEHPRDMTEVDFLKLRQKISDNMELAL